MKRIALARSRGGFKATEITRTSRQTLILAQVCSVGRNGGTGGTEGTRGIAGDRGNAPFKNPRFLL